MNAFLETWSRVWADWALAASWQIAVLIVLVAIAAFMSRRLSARFRYLLWMLVIIKALTPPSFGTAWSIGNWAPHWGKVSVTIAAAPEKQQPIGTASAKAVVHENGNFGNDGKNGNDGTHGTYAATENVIAVQQQVRAPAPMSLNAILLIVWAVGFVGLMGFIVYRYRRLTRMLSGATEVDEGPLRVMLEKLALSLNRSNPPDLLLSDAVTSPFLFGILKPRIVLPSDLPNQLNSGQLEDVLLHELIHWRRRDLLSGWLQIVVQALFWFHPLVWLAGAQLRHERECACDEAALESGCSQARRYGESLLKVLLAARGRSAVAMGFLGIFERNTRLQSRLEEIMNQETRVRRLKWWGWVSLAVFAILCLPMAALSQNGGDDSNLTPLHQAAAGGHLDTVKMLLGKGADVNARTQNGRTPLHFAALGGHMQTAEAIIAKGADVNARDDHGNTPLSLASANGHIGTAEMLIKKGAEINPAFTPRPVPQNEEPSQSDEVGINFVRVVLGEKGEMTFEGQPTTIEDLPKLLEKIPNRPNTVLTFAVASDKMMPVRKNGQLRDMIAPLSANLPENVRKTFERIIKLSQELGFKHVSFIGVHPLGSYGIGESAYEPMLHKEARVQIDKSPDGSNLSLQYAVKAICESVGIPYQFDKSARLADPDRRQFVPPLNVNGVTVEKALIDVLKPIGLRFNLDENGLFLYKPVQHVSKSEASGSSKDDWQAQLNPDQLAFANWTESFFDRFLDRRDFSKWSAQEREAELQRCLNLLGGPQERPYYNAINTLGAIGDARAVKPLLAVATDKIGRDARDNWMAVRALGMIGDKSAVPDLVHLTYFGNANVHLWAQVSLVRLTGQNFGYDWKKWGEWWNAQGGQPPVTFEKIRWFDTPNYDELTTPQALQNQDQKFLGEIAPNPPGRASQDSEPSTQHSAIPKYPNWSAMQATGAPDTMQAGDIPTAWASLEPDQGEQWLELDYNPPIRASMVRIHETFNPGAVTKVIVYEQQASGISQTEIPVTDDTKTAPAFCEVRFPITDAPVTRVRVVLDTNKVPGWNEIDAVELVGPDGRGWATNARASSSYADRLKSSPAPTPAESKSNEQPGLASYFQTPRIVSISPAIGATNVDSNTSAIVVTFDRDMDTRGYSWTGGGPNFPKTPEGKRPFWRDARTCVMPVALEPARYYRLGINATSYQNFQSKDGVPVDPVSIYFTTNNAPSSEAAKLKKPQIVSMVPPNGATDVDPNLKEIRVTFDVAMGSGFSWVGGGEDYPETGESARWSDDRKTCILPVTLKPGHDYRLGLNSVSFQNFSSENGVPLDPVVYRFKTKPE